MRRLQVQRKFRWQVEQAMGVASQRIDLAQPEQVGPGLSSMSPAKRSSNRRCRAGCITPVTKKLSPSRLAILGMVESNSSVFRKRP